MRKHKDARTPGSAESRTRICGILLCLGVFMFLIQNRLLQGQIATTLAITGSVQDQSGAAFLGAQVDLLKDGQQRSTTTTDTSGAFRFDSLQPGNYEVRTYREGFKTDITKVTVGNRSPGRLRIVLSIENLNQQISVSGDNPEVSTDPSENRDVAAVDRQALMICRSSTRTSWRQCLAFWTAER